MPKGFSGGNTMLRQYRIREYMQGVAWVPKVGAIDVFTPVQKALKSVYVKATKDTCANL